MCIRDSSKDVEKLERIGAVQCLETIPKPEIKINVIKNPIKVEETKEQKDSVSDIPLLHDTDLILNKKQIERISVKTEKPKRKYNKRRDFRKRRY